MMNDDDDLRRSVGVGQVRSSVSTYIHFSFNLIIAPSMINMMMMIR